MLFRLFLSTAVAAGTAFVFAQSHASIPTSVQTAMGQLSKERFRAHMAFLADDLLEGRGTGTRGHELAARYIAAQFEALGLKPAGDHGTYYQRVPLREITVDPSGCSASLNHDGTTQVLKSGDDFLMRGSELELDVSLEASVVFVGYGVKTPDGSYNDYAGVDVKGKIAAELWGAPPTLATELRAHLSSSREKLRTARDQGAIGIVALWAPEMERMLPWVRVVSSTGFPSMKWLGPDGQPADSFPELRVAAVLSQSASARLFQHAPKSWTEVLRDAKDSKPQGFPLPLTMRLRTAIRFRDTSSPNVAAVLPGADPKNEYVVYTAHSDHLGIGAPINGDAIYNGALDNASGVAALLVIAQAFQSLQQPPARSILFLSATAEEKGMLLLGSDYYAHFPTVPIQDIVADLNMDVASVFYTFKDIVPHGAPDSTLGRVVERDALRLGLKVSPDPKPAQTYFVRSDQYSFVRQGVPSVFISEGYEAKNPKFDAKKFKQQWRATRYHAPSDDMSQPMNLDASVQFMQLHFLLGYDIANHPQRPRWNPGDFFGEPLGRE